MTVSAPPVDALRTPLRDLRIAVLDVETTGFSATNDRICEIAVVLVRGLELHGVYQTLVNPEVPIPEATSQVHGLFDHHVAHAATFREIAGAVGAVLRGSDLVVCHNVTFDLGFIQASLGRAGHPVLVGSTLCTLASAKQQWPAGPNKLAAVAARIGVTVPELAQHRAVDDAELTARVLIQMAESRGASCAAAALGGFTKSATAFVK